jgi:YhcH/YjgK/YiaL family protein
MLVEPLIFFPKFFHLHPLFRAAHEFLVRIKEQGIPEGTFPLENEKLIAIVEQKEGKTHAGARLEAHRKYIDIHYTLQGVDTIGWRPLSLCSSIAQEYQKTSDKMFFHEKPTSWIDVSPELFAIFYPYDTHAPLCGTNHVKKVVIKVPFFV